MLWGSSSGQGEQDSWRVGLDGRVTNVVLSVLSSDKAARVHHGSLTRRLKYIPDRVGCIVSSQFAPRRNCVMRDHHNNKNCVGVAETACSLDALGVRLVGSVKGGVSRESYHTRVIGLRSEKLLRSGRTTMVLTTATSGSCRSIPRRLHSGLETGVFGRVLVSSVGWKIVCVLYRGYNGCRTAARVGEVMGNRTARTRLYSSYTHTLNCSDIFPSFNFGFSSVLNSFFGRTAINTLDGNVIHYRGYNDAFGSVMEDNEVNYNSYCDAFCSGLLPSFRHVRNEARRRNGGTGASPRVGGLDGARRLGRGLGRTIRTRGCRRTTHLHSRVGGLRDRSGRG